MNETQPQRFPWNLDWNLLRTFIVVVEQRSISNAADFLGLKQPTVSAALKRLEDTTGKQLVIRKANEFTVTRPGQALYAECAQIFGTISQLPSLLNEDPAELRGHLSIAITSAVHCDHFDEILSDFAKAHPNVTYSFAIHESEEVEAMVRQNRASFGICLLSKIPRNLNSIVLYREFFGLYCGARHPLFAANEITPKDLKDESFVSFQTEAEGRPLHAASQLRARLGLATGWRGGSSSLNEIRRLIVANVGIGALPLHVAQQDVDAGRLRQLPPYDKLPMVEIYLINNPARRPSEVETEFFEKCFAALNEIDIEERTYGLR